MRLVEARNDAVAAAVREAVGPAAKESVTAALGEQDAKQSKRRRRIVVVVRVLYGAAVAVRLARWLPPGRLSRSRRRLGTGGSQAAPLRRTHLPHPGGG